MSSVFLCVSALCVLCVSVVRFLDFQASAFRVLRTLSAKAVLMGRIVSIHSYRGGTGKSNTTANLAATVAQAGRRVGIVDTDIQSPGIHVLFGLDESKINRALNDY